MKSVILLMAAALFCPFTIGEVAYEPDPQLVQKYQPAEGAGRQLVFNLKRPAMTAPISDRAGAKRAPTSSIATRAHG